MTSDVGGLRAEDRDQRSPRLNSPSSVRKAELNGARRTEGTEVGCRTSDVRGGDEDSKGL